MSNPYMQLPERAFWKLAVGSRNLFDVREVWTPKFHIQQKHKVVTFGSCFAQHIGRAMKARSFDWYNAEKGPESLSQENIKRFSYNVFSARTGNIYTTSLLLQWTRWALGKAKVPDEHWESPGRIFDPFRPAIEPDGFENLNEMLTSRRVALKAFRRCILDADYFVFTLGLTESWKHASDGYEYPVCPGTVAGEFDGSSHVFHNQPFLEIYSNLKAAMDLITTNNPNVRFILTVSPVPLTATNSGQHVMVATMASKSILRAVTAQILSERDDVDYFPSYELINSPVTKGVFFEPNQREVTRHGVNFVMDHFFKSLEEKFGAYAVDEKVASLPKEQSDLVCEEEILQAFGPTA